MRLEIALQPLQQRPILPLARFEETRVPRKAAESGQPRLGRVGVIRHQAREGPRIDPIARHILDRSADSECQQPEIDLIADLETELRHQSGWQEYAVSPQHCVGVPCPVRQLYLAVQRVLLLYP